MNRPWVWLLAVGVVFGMMVGIGLTFWLVVLPRSSEPTPSVFIQAFSLADAIAKAGGPTSWTETLGDGSVQVRNDFSSTGGFFGGGQTWAKCRSWVYRGQIAPPVQPAFLAALEVEFSRLAQSHGGFFLGGAGSSASGTGPAGTHLIHLLEGEYRADGRSGFIHFVLVAEGENCALSVIIVEPN